MAPRVLVSIRGCRQPQAGSPFDFAQGRSRAPRTSSPRYMRILPVTGRSSRVVRLSRVSFEKSKEIARTFQRELIVYQRVLRDQRTPVSAKLFLALAIGYLCMPFDLIPDFIPVIGHLDDAIVIPALVLAALHLVPRGIVSEHREQVIREEAAISAGR
jgi:uncharacterized membrane protein YkvA (DUF1232 family)